MKKSLVLLASVLALGSFVPSAYAEDNPNQKRIDEIEAQIKELEAELKELKGDVEDEENIVLDNELCKVTFVGSKEKDDRLEFVFEVENKSDDDYTFQAELISIDGYMIELFNGLMSDSISAGKKGKIRMTIYESDDEELPEVTGDLEFTLLIFKNDDYFDVTKYPITVELNRK